MTISITNQTDANGNTFVRINTNGTSNIDVPCGAYRVQIVEAPTGPAKFNIRGQTYYVEYIFRREDVLLPASASDADLLDKITDILNCCTCG